MNINDINNIAQAWISMHLSKEGENAYLNNFWAYEKISDLAATNPRECIAAISKVLSFSNDEIVDANLAAGPLEDVLTKNGEAVAGDVITLCKIDPRWKKLVGAVWKNDIKDDVWTKLQAVCSPSW